MSRAALAAFAACVDRDAVGALSVSDLIRHAKRREVARLQAELAELDGRIAQYEARFQWLTSRWREER